MQCIRKLKKSGLRTQKRNAARSEFRIIFLFFLCQFFVLTTGFSQKTDTIFLSQKLNYEGLINASKSTQIFIDSTKKVNSQSVDSQVFASLKDFKFKQLSFEYFNYVFWIKMTVKNPSDSLIKTLFTAGVHKEVEVFSKENGIYKSVNLTRQEWLQNERPFRFDEQYVPLTFEPNRSYQLLVKITEDPQLNFKIVPKFVSYNWEYKDKTRGFYDEYWYLIQDGFYVSVLFFIAIYAFILYLIERKKYYIYYSIYLFFLLLFSFWAIEHSPYIQIFFSYIPFLKFSANNNTYLLLTNIYYNLFINNFLELPKIAPKFSKIMLIYVRYVLGGLLVIDTFINFVWHNYSLGGYIWILAQPVIVLFGIYGIYQLFKLKGKLAIYIQVGSTALMTGAIFGFLEQLLFLKPADNVIMRLAPSLPFNTGVLIEIICFSAALGYKTWLTQREQNRLIKAVKESELRTLRSQINPHFVFNSLNSIKSYILTHRSLEAAEYLTDFSTLMRSILQYSKEQLISLKDELETTLLYIRLEQLRFEDNFEFIYELQEGIDTDEILIPPMLLQPYIENAIKHGLMNKEGKKRLILKIEQTEKEIIITIEDNGIGREQASLLRKNTLKHQSMGMNINNERVNLLSQTNDLHIEINIEDKKSSLGKTEGTKVIIHIPVE